MEDYNDVLPFMLHAQSSNVLSMYPLLKIIFLFAGLPRCCYYGKCVEKKNPLLVGIFLSG